MDGKPPTYEELVELTRLQARQIEQLRAEVERLKADLEQSRRAGKASGRTLLQGHAQGRPQAARAQARAPAQPSARPAAGAGRSHHRGARCRRTARSATRHSARPKSRSMTNIRSTCPSPSRSSPASESRWPAARLATSPGPGTPPRADLQCPGFGGRPVRPASARPRRRPEASPGRVSYRKCSSVLLTLTGVVVASAALVRSGPIACGSWPCPAMTDWWRRPRRVPSSTSTRPAGRSAAGRPGCGSSPTSTPRSTASARAGPMRWSSRCWARSSAGVLVSDCFLAYDPLPFAKQKCLAHLLKTCRRDRGGPRPGGRCGSVAEWRRCSARRWR